MSDPEFWPYPGLAVIFGMFLVFPVTLAVLIGVKWGVLAVCVPAGSRCKILEWRHLAVWVLGLILAVLVACLLPHGRTRAMVMGEPASFTNELWPWLMLTGPVLAVMMVTLAEWACWRLGWFRLSTRLAPSLALLASNGAAFLAAGGVGTVLAYARFVR